MNKNDLKQMDFNNNIIADSMIEKLQSVINRSHLITWNYAEELPSFYINSPHYMFLAIIINHESSKVVIVSCGTFYFFNGKKKERISQKDILYWAEMPPFPKAMLEEKQQKEINHKGSEIKVSDATKLRNGSIIYYDNKLSIPRLQIQSEDYLILTSEGIKQFFENRITYHEYILDDEFLINKLKFKENSETKGLFEYEGSSITLYKTCSTDQIYQIYINKKYFGGVFCAHLLQNVFFSMEGIKLEENLL